MSQAPLTQILKSLAASNVEELNLLKSLVRWAQQVQEGSSIQALNGISCRLGFSEDLDPVAFLRSLPAELHRYFHGLVEALEIYHSIHGRPVSVAELSLSNGSVRELKQIRDMCLEEGLRSIY